MSGRTDQTNPPAQPTVARFHANAPAHSGYTTRLNTLSLSWYWLIDPAQYGSIKNGFVLKSAPSPQEMRLSLSPDSSTERMELTVPRGPAPPLFACHECDLIQREVRLRPGGAALCARCGAVLYRNVPDGLDRTLAVTLAAAALFVLANVFPIVGLEASGQHTSATLLGTVMTLHEQDMTSVAALVFVTTFLAPAVHIGSVLYLLLPLKLGRVPEGLPAVFRVVQAVRPWGMVEVFMLGTLVSLAKLSHLAAVKPGVALWSFGALMLLVAAGAASFDARALWARVEAVR